MFRSLVRGLLRGKRREAVAMDTYLNCCATIQKLIDTHKLGINLKDRHVVLDVSLHRAFMPHGTSARSIRESDRRYAAFFDKVVAYMNLQLGRMQKSDFIDPKKDAVTFHVTVETKRYVDDDGYPLPAHRQVTFNTLLVGYYRDGTIDYKPLEEDGTT